MRFLFCLVIWIVVVGGLRVYTWHRDAGLPAGPSPVQAVEQVEGAFLLELTPTFSLEKDPFALDTGTQSDALLTLNLNGRTLEVPEGELLRGKKIRIRDLPWLQAGSNEIYVKASPPLAESMMDHGLRVRLLDRGFVIADNTVWGDRGALVSGTIRFRLTLSEDDGHDH
ncbi:MAG: hypothetical protein JEZ12_16315 [Desulfobacterium sp.]|nr:hypothetical protein [Desulfobacterium sp.]